MTSAQWIRRVVKPAVFVLAAVPAVLLLEDFVADGFGPNPIEEITHRTGRWGLTLLVAALAVTPVRLVTRLGAVIQLRRMLGLYAFFYLSLHFLTYFALDQFFAWGAIVEDVAKRPYITVGFTSFLLLIPLAVTSTDRMVKRLGGKRWRKLHRLAYVAAAGGVLHFLWLVKVDTTRPVIYGVVLVGLLAVRLWDGRRTARRRREVSVERSDRAAVFDPS